MNNCKFATTSAICCGICLAIAPSASADFVGVTTVNKLDEDTQFLCVQGNGDFVPYPLTVCNVSAAFDHPNDILLSVGSAELQVFSGPGLSVFYHHPGDFGSNTSYGCSVPTTSPPFGFPDIICDSYVTIGLKCNDGTDATATNVDDDEFADNGHLVGGWFNGSPPNGQGVAGYYPDLQVLFVQSSVSLGLSMSGTIDIFWAEDYGGEVYGELAVPVECAAQCVPGEVCSDGDPCTTNDVCSEDGSCVRGTPINCDNGNPCTDDVCDSNTGMCVNTPLPDGTPCDDGNACTVGGECMNGKCGGGLSIDCDDDNPCTDDGCDPESGCTVGPGDCDDNNQCTDDSCDPELGCMHASIDCADGNPCTDDHCDADGGCFSVPNSAPGDDDDPCTENDTCIDGAPSGTPVQCPEGQSCDPASGECVADHDPCECVNGRVTLCHVPQGNPAKAHTIIVGCAARDKHLDHGDTCGPCE